MVIMSNAAQYSDSEDTLTSSDCSDCSDNESSDNDKDDTSDVASYRSLAFRVRKNRSTVTVKSKKRNKRVRFKPGDSLVLIYVIPNREMLGLKSDSEDSDSDDSGDDSDDEGEDDEDEDDYEDDDDDQEDDAEDDDDESDDEDKFKKRKEKIKKPKPFAKLLAVRQVNRCKLPDIRNTISKSQEKPKLVKLNLNTTSIHCKKVPRLKPNRKENREKTNSAKRDSKSSVDSKAKPSRYKKNKFNAIKTDNKVKRNVSRLLEIHATVRSANKHHETHAVPKLLYKNDTKPSVINSNSSVIMNTTAPLTNRARLQPTSFRITQLEADSVLSQNTHDPMHQPKPSAHVVTACYDSVSSVLPSSYVRLNSFENTTVKETIKRLDPDSMNTSGKRNYAWQIANGTITSQSLRTPSILPFWDSLLNSVSESNTVKLPT